MHPTIAKLTSDRPGGDRRGMGHPTPAARACRSAPAPTRGTSRSPEKVEEVARAYVEAGSQVILTNTFGANRFILARHGWPTRWPRSTGPGVEISRRAAAGRAVVFASIGPSGVMLMMGQVSRGRAEGRLRRAGPGHRRRPAPTAS